MADSRPVKSKVVELQCGRCYQTVSFDAPAAGAPLFCPICKEPIPALAPAETAPETDRWWVTDSPSPSSAPAPAKPTSNAVRVVPVLKKCLRDEEPAIRAAAAEKLGDLGDVVRQVDREVVPLLVELWKKDRDEVRRAAFDALKKIAPAEIRPGKP